VYKGVFWGSHTALVGGEILSAAAIRAEGGNIEENWPARWRQVRQRHLSRGPLRAVNWRHLWGLVPSSI
jgi:hypothetical protein